MNPLDATVGVWRTTRPVTVGVLHPALLAGLFVAFVAWSEPARASPECKTLAEARAAYHGRYLYWHTSRHCWNARKYPPHPLRRQ
jgi:hypothetical protein